MDCLFCKIASGEIPSTKVYEDDLIFAFRDINPQAPVHTLVIPRAHLSSADDVDESNSAVIARIFEKIPQIAKDEGITNGYRIISNCGSDAAQSVKHLHFHILGGRPMTEKMC